VPLRDDAGEILARERDARAEAQARREELERITESRTRLMRGFSHDVKNPLGAADGYAALLEEGIGGDVTVESEVRRGSTLMRWLPPAPASGASPDAG
jgi:nitrogen-specific signal transduction histidine kinase